MDERLVRLLGGHDLAWLRQRVRAGLESGRLPAAVTLRSPTAAQRLAVAGLLGRRLPIGEAVTVRLSDVDGVLRRLGFDLADAVVALEGPVRDRPAERRAAIDDREAPYVAIAEAAASLPWAEDWLDGVRRSRMLARLPDADARTRVLASALELAAVVTAPAAPVTARNELAARMCGDAHALDDGTVRSALVLRALTVVAGQPVPSSTGERRALWELFGVMSDAVSSTCLTLGLRPLGRSPLSARLTTAADAGDPVHITAWDLSRSELVVPAGLVVLVCENPRVLEAVAQRCCGSVAVVCTAGMPSLVTMDLLRRLAGVGSTLRYHGDFDWPGIAIANRLVATVGCEPWLMTAVDYLSAARPDGPALEGPAMTPCWDPALGNAMASKGIAVHEEAVLDAVLGGLQGAASPSQGQAPNALRGAVHTNW